MKILKINFYDVITSVLYSHLHFGKLHEVLLIIQLVSFCKGELLSTTNQYSLIDRSEIIDGKEVDEYK